MRSVCRCDGQIKVKGWLPFSAEEVIRWDRGMIWLAVVRMHGIQIRRGDTFLDGEGATRWKLFGLLPMVNASGTDVTRSAAGPRQHRVHMATFGALYRTCILDVHRRLPVPCEFHGHNEPAEVDYGIDQDGRLKTVSMPRWDNPGGADFRYANCGGLWRPKANSAATRHQLACAWGGTSAQRGLNLRESSSASSSMTRRTAELYTVALMTPYLPAGLRIGSRSQRLTEPRDRTSVGPVLAVSPPASPASSRSWKCGRLAATTRAAWITPLRTLSVRPQTHIQTAPSATRVPEIGASHFFPHSHR